MSIDFYSAGTLKDKTVVLSHIGHLHIWRQLSGHLCLSNLSFSNTLQTLWIHTQSLQWRRVLESMHLFVDFPACSVFSSSLSFLGHLLFIGCHMLSEPPLLLTFQCSALLSSICPSNVTKEIRGCLCDVPLCYLLLEPCLEPSKCSIKCWTYYHMSECIN